MVLAWNKYVKSLLFDFIDRPNREVPSVRNDEL